MFGNKYKAKELKEAVKVTGISLDKAKDISEKYDNLSQCCSVLSSLEMEDDLMSGLHNGGWKVSKYSISFAGIDINKVYEYIKNLALERKTELEAELKDI